jgi:hypothetical protein
MKNCRGRAGSIVFVKVKLPLPVNVFVAITVQLVRGKATLVLVRTRYWVPGDPPAPLKMTFVPTRVTAANCS